jgi:endoglucanase
VRARSIDEALRTADFVTLHVPLGNATRHLIDADRLQAMKPKVVVLNFAREGIVDEAAMVKSLDAGHAHWQSASTMASRLAAAGIASVTGFSLNVSNFITDADNVAYGEQLSSLIGGKHFIIDSGRNGLGPTGDMQWCNPEGRAIGRRPTTRTGNPLVDAYLWIKTPGESDGACNGYPSSGTWIPEYALGLASRG